LSLALLGQLVGVAAASGTRATLTLLALALVARVGAYSLPAGLEFLSTNVGLALLVALTVLDELVDRDPELQELLTLANVGVRGAAGAIGAWGIEGMMGGSMPDAVTWLLGAGIAIGVHLVRVQAMAYIPEGTSGFGPRTWIAWLEAGGVFGLLIAVFLAPLLALAFAVAASLLGAVLLVSARSIERARHRRRCPHCSAWARREASRCPKCRHAIAIERRCA
jgi:hypothetical protein